MRQIALRWNRWRWRRLCARLGIEAQHVEKQLHELVRQTSAENARVRYA